MIKRFVAEMNKLTFILFIFLLFAILPMDTFAQKHPKLQNLPSYDNKKIISKHVTSTHSEEISEFQDYLCYENELNTKNN